MTAQDELAELQALWLAEPDGENGHQLGEALEKLGRIDEAADVYRQLVEDQYLIGFADLAWLERERGNVALACELLQKYLELDDDPDEQTHLVQGVLGHWLWHFELRQDAEALLREGADYYESARADLAKLLRVTDRPAEAEFVLREGVAKGEVQSYLPLANLLDKTDRPEEAERIYRLGFALGDAHCAYNLYKQLLEQGRELEADDWLWRAAEGGDEKAIAWIAEMGMPDES